MGLYTNRILAPTKELSADWFPEEGEIFRDASGNFYCGDNVTASNALTPINGGGGGGTPMGLPYNIDLQNQTSTGISLGYIRFNQTPPENSTEIYIHESDANGQNFASTFDQLAGGGIVYISVDVDPSAYCVWHVTGAADGGSAYVLTASYEGGVLPPDEATVRILIVPSLLPIRISNLTEGDIITWNGTEWQNSQP
jgi:hypothetical protein